MKFKTSFFQKILNIAAIMDALDRLSVLSSAILITTSSSSSASSASNASQYTSALQIMEDERISIEEDHEKVLRERVEVERRLLEVNNIRALAEKARNDANAILEEAQRKNENAQALANTRKKDIASIEAAKSDLEKRKIKWLNDQSEHRKQQERDWAVKVSQYEREFQNIMTCKDMVMMFCLCRCKER
jgi:hypothetical protein